MRNDFELDAKAKQYADAHRVSYSEALSVCAEESSASGVSKAAQEGKASEFPSDAEMHQQAMMMARVIGVLYIEALTRLAAAVNARNFSAQVSSANFSSAVPLTDIAIDARAKGLMCQHDISYETALAHAAAGTVPAFSQSTSGAVCFSEDGAAAYDVPPAEAMEGQLIEIFKAGTHITSAGQSITFSPEDVEAIAANYQPTQREAPLVEGHPPEDAPSQGWVSALVSHGGRLFMRVKQVAPAFAEAVRAGRFKKRSAAFYPPNSPMNPTPGGWYLRHVGFLGAHQPAVAGLADIQFSISL